MTDGGGLHSTSLALSLGLLTGAAVALSRPSVERERDDLTTNYGRPAGADGTIGQRTISKAKVA
jgi:hypothetical protein